MMSYKNKRNLIIGAAAAFCLMAIYFGLLAFQDMKRREAADIMEKESEKATLLSLSPEDITEISFDGTGGKLTFLFEDGKVSLREAPDAPLREDAVERLLSPLYSLRVSRKVEEGGESEEKELSQYGLSPAQNKVKIVMPDREVLLLVGDRNASAGEVYFQVDGSPDVYLTDSALDRIYSGKAEDFIAYEVFPQIRASEIRKIEVQKDSGSFMLETPGDDRCTVTDEKGHTEEAGLNLAGQVQNNLSNMTWLSNVEYSCEDFGKYGLEHPQTVIRIACGEAVVLEIGDTDESGNYFVRLSGSNEVHTVRREYLELLCEGSAQDFWSLAYSFVSIGDLDELEVFSGGESHVLRVHTDDDGTEHYLVDEQEVEKQLFTDFYYACVSVTAQKRLSEVPDENKEDAILRLRYALKDGSRKEISYYSYDQNFCLVVYADGTKAANTNRIYVDAMLDAWEKLIAE